jgi:hypothetical protein
VVLPNIVSGAGSRMLVPVSVFRTTARNPFAPTTRTHTIYFPYSNTEKDVVKLTIPEGMSAVTIPPAADLKGGVLGYAASTTRKGNEVTYTRNANVNVMFIPVENYPQLRNFFNAVAAEDAQQLVINSSSKSAGGTQ